MNDKSVSSPLDNLHPFVIRFLGHSLEVVHLSHQSLKIYPDVFT